MATLLELERRGFLIHYDAGLMVHELPQRLIFLSSDAARWMERKLPELESNWNTSISPLAQVDALLARFCAGRKLAHEKDFKVLNPRNRGVWELKTADVRLFGWFVSRDCFVLASCEAAKKLKSANPSQLNLYHRNINQVAGFRDTLQLDEPKFVAGDEINDVVSTWN
jgi:hypothetical protein